MRFSKWSVLVGMPLMVAVALTVSSSAVLANTIVLSDDFSSANGDLVGTTPDVSTGDWTQTGTSATNPIQIVSNQVALVNTGQDAYAAFSQAVPTTAGAGLLTSMDINVSAASANGDYFSHLSSPAGTTTVFDQRLFARSSTGGFQLGLLDTSGTGSATTWGTTDLSFGTSYHVDILWNFVAGSNNDTFSVSVDGSPYLTHAWTSATAEPADLQAGNFRQGGSSTFPSVLVDNLVVQTVPEPSTILLGSLIGIGCLAFRRRVR